jgi:hypothetical protein
MCGSGLVPTPNPRTRLARVDRVRDRPPRGTVGERGNAPKGPHGRGSGHGCRRALRGVPGPCLPSKAPCGSTDRFGRGYGQLKAGSRRERVSARSDPPGTWRCPSTHRIELDEALVLHFRSPCRVPDVSGRGASRRAPVGPRARTRGNPALSPVRPLPPARPRGVRADRTAPRRKVFPQPQRAVPGRPRGICRLGRDWRCRAEPRSLRGSHRLARRGERRREARRRCGGPGRKANRCFTGISEREH